MMKLRNIFMFSGQGSQYYQMGFDLFETNQIFKETMLQADTLCQQWIGESIINHIYSAQAKKSILFKKTLYTHPAIFMVECALLSALQEKKIFPDVVLGSSLGEFAAAVAAGVLTPESGLEAVIRQAEVLEKCSAGGMLAILANASLYDSKDYLKEKTELAAINFDSHFVVSGKTENIKEAMTQLVSEKIIHQELPVTHAFHSSLIDQGKKEFLDLVATIPLHKPTIPFISSTRGEEVKTMTWEHLWDCTRLPMQMQKTIQTLEKEHPSLYIDVGPSGTMATFVKYNLNAESQSQIQSLLTPFGSDLQNLTKLLERTSCP